MVMSKLSRMCGSSSSVVLLFNDRSVSSLVEKKYARVSKMNNVPMDTAARMDNTRPRKDDSVRSEGTRWYNIVLNYSLVLSMM